MCRGHAHPDAPGTLPVMCPEARNQSRSYESVQVGKRAVDLELKVWVLILALPLTR